MLGLRNRGRWILILVLGASSEAWPASGFVARAWEMVRGLLLSMQRKREEENREMMVSN
jgi:hypothetical protein